MTGKIIKGIAGFYYVSDGKGRVYECKAKGVFRSRKIKPLVGDNVEFSVLDEEKAEGNIEEILPRKNSLVRPAAANVDQALVVFALTHPAPNLNLLDRFLVMMEQQEIPVVICFNKLDLGDDEGAACYKEAYIRAGYKVMLVSAHTGEGIEEVKALLSSKTTVLAGPSGVGKSSLTNCIFPVAAMETGEISRKIERGKHTTRHSQLFLVEEDTYLMDTPGFSSMFTPDLEAEELKEYFPEFKGYEEGCRFLGCVHIGEPVCGVKEAVKNGQLSQSRYDNYRLMYEELKQKRRY